MQNNNASLLPAWQQLKTIHQHMAYHQRIEAPFVHCQIQHQHLPQQALHHLFQLCQEQDLEDAQFQWLNQGIHTTDEPQYMLLRQTSNTSHAARFQVEQAKQMIEQYANQIRQQQWLGYSDLAITDVVNIGMGGSDLGPKLCCEALAHMANTHIRCHFISDACQFAFEHTLKDLNPATTLFLISSKSFNTEETLNNFKKALHWVNHPQALQKHFIAITAHQERAEQHGFMHILPIWEWVVGRYSCFSAINFISAIMLGYQGFQAFLDGAQAMDMHFLNTPIAANLPILLALIGIWNINFLNIPSHLMLMDDSRLRHFIDYVQQLDMESNGKSVNRYGEPIDYATSPIIWGGLGNPSHHSYYQLLAQGSHQVAMDYISCHDPKNAYIQSLCEARKNVLHHGIESEQGPKGRINQQVAINHLYIEQLNAQSLGALIALHEHKVFIQAWIWNINPFDQPGVETAKRAIEASRNTMKSAVE
jgi:glucose-6-phosphate isomerase